MSRGGFTLVEVLIALLLLEVGVLGAVGILVLAGRTLTEAERTERAVAALEGVADSLRAVAGPPAPGRRTLPGGSRLEWIPRGGAFEVFVVDGSDTLVAALAPGRPGS